MNRVRLTFEFSGLPDGADEDLVSDAIEALAQIVEGLNDGTASSLEVAARGLGGPDRPWSGGDANVQITVSRS